MTWRDLVATRKPFLVTSQGGEFHFYPCGDLMLIQDPVHPGGRASYTPMQDFLTDSLVPDGWDCFEREEYNTARLNLCVCDFVTVILRSGCKCGGR